MTGGAYLDAVEAVIGDRGATPATIFARVGIGAKVSVQHALCELCEQGRCRFEGAPTKRLYFKASSTARESARR